MLCRMELLQSLVEVTLPSVALIVEGKTIVTENASGNQTLLGGSFGIQALVWIGLET